MSSALLTVSNISKSFHYKSVLKNIHFSLSPGETIALIGKNGAGKSTLLRILAKISTPENGQVEFENNNILTGVAANRQGIYYCGHAPGFYPSLTAGQNLNYISAFHGCSNTTEKISSILQDYHLFDAIDEPVKVYSQGMLQRLKLAMIELIDWSLLLIDEPFNSLDMAGREFVKNKMQAWQNGKRCILFVDHDIKRALELSSRILLLDKHSIAMDEPTSSPSLVVKITEFME
ncbi:MAG TPA: ABC transporter ATP-binding protein [Candidatus Marinimicrobia bacterium]|nr:ABC transporter ATP-binding protein [Candidatus Neomarinimicrobiota bacterium]MDP7216861.1 ABC transporter ATP-binding protein [Candidatus Neomarinimicrobiota bacterium]HJL73842.1 ABC transporter ATP-binding protein [Candidatus Neomarinimicrobiota bacterium]HJM69878.1 ABC transporter ATP-binding protein [Candidatus Neomarinimicrobiota bacterium]